MNKIFPISLIGFFLFGGCAALEKDNDPDAITIPHEAKLREQFKCSWDIRTALCNI